MEEKDIDVTEETNWVEAGTTTCDHNLALAPSDPNSNLISATCTKCMHGVSFDGNEHELKEGKMVKKEKNA